MGAWAAGGPGVVELPDGRRVRVRGLRHGDVAGEEPELGIYLLGSPPPTTPWPALWIRWPDFRLPTDRDGALATLRQAHERAVAERVELACGGGIGRTGTALAVLAVLSGVDPAEAVPWVRRHHHPRAVETPWQRRWVAGLSRT
ncbi:MAG TPA: protein-tyrosine phosphatase family protein [Acidimicrobiales bacterium]|nr:protein-tyrosine phosphatase family protein [Acidimicrobiales bacterium]